MGTQVALGCELVEGLMLRKSTSWLVELYAMLVAMAKKDLDLGESHSVEEAEARHVRKRRSQKGEGQGASSQEG